MRLTLLVHIAAGAIAIGAGYVALSTFKGGRAHRRSGRAFVYGMLTMGLMGTWLAVTRNAAPEANVPAGLLTTYLVVTGLTTVKPLRVHGRLADIGLTLLALGIGVVDLGFGIRAVESPKGTLHGIPAFPFFLFGIVALLAVAGDVRLIRAGGTSLVHGTTRLTRHLWRLYFAHAIAVFSFFLGQAKVLPKELRIFPLLAIPPLIVLGALFYWLWRVRFRPPSRRIRTRHIVEPA